MTEEVQGSQEQEQQPEVKVAGSKKGKGTGDLFFDVAAEVEALTQTKALNLAETLAENIEANYFKMGGVLNRIYEQSWWTGNSFEDYVFEKFGFKKRKADYLISIYKGLVDKQIPWGKVAHLGWTKLKDIVPVLTLENLDEWVTKAESLTVLELQAALKATPDAGGDTTVNASSGNVKVKFDLKQDQAETVTQALNKAKAETGTEFDSVALENIAAGYLSGQIATSVDAHSLGDALKAMGWEEALKFYVQVFPGVDLAVEKVNGDGTVEAAAQAA